MGVEEQQQAFDQIKKIIGRETLLAFPYFNKEFHIYTESLCKTASHWHSIVKN
jgi:hypothetical protein